MTQFSMHAEEKKQQAGNVEGPEYSFLPKCFPSEMQKKHSEFW